MLKSRKRRILWAKKIKFENLVDFQLVGPLKRPITVHGQPHIQLYPWHGQNWLLKAFVVNVNIWRSVTFSGISALFNFYDVKSMMASLEYWHWTAVQQYGPHTHQSEEQVAEWQGSKACPCIAAYTWVEGRRPGRWSYYGKPLRVGKTSNLSFDRGNPIKT